MDASLRARIHEAVSFEMTMTPHGINSMWLFIFRKIIGRPHGRFQWPVFMMEEEQS
ncbi:hypothetical protein [Lacticaseibacillus sp. GG6-2]